MELQFFSNEKCVTIFFLNYEISSISNNSENIYFSNFDI
jgi:hypothetical protein